MQIFESPMKLHFVGMVGIANRDLIEKLADEGGSLDVNVSET
jgi:hypothetical protein